MATEAFLEPMSWVLCAALKLEKGGKNRGREVYPRYSRSLQCTPSVFYSDVHGGQVPGTWYVNAASGSCKLRIGIFI